MLIKKSIEEKEEKVRGFVSLSHSWLVFIVETHESCEGWWDVWCLLHNTYFRLLANNLKPLTPHILGIDQKCLWKTATWNTKHTQTLRSTFVETFLSPFCQWKWKVIEFFQHCHSRQFPLWRFYATSVTEINLK